ncbi:hypothetical protein ACFWY5_48810 [Nonomuraea sp. NPDC059007]|uniref:hypothetical protein n=1 Tax=Nonomuraea sp. NPDC059007 TaxID=3346692 RepID=UPI003689AAF7
MRTSPRKLRNTLSWYAFGFSCVVTLLAAVLMVIFDPGLTTAAVLSAIGLNLIASVVFAVVFTILSSQVQQRGLEENIAQHLDDMALGLRAEVAAQHKDFMPTATYSPFDPIDGTYGDAFNRDMTASLETTGFYAFCGPSARYVPARLTRSRHFPHQVRVAMLSPGDKLAISRRATDRTTWVRLAGKDNATLAEELREELIMSTVALFDYRHICPVDLVYIEDTATYRFEIFDDAIYLSWYHGPQSISKEMPESLRFAAQSFLYQLLRLDLMRRFEIVESRVRFEAGQDDAFLIAHLTSVLGTSVGAADLRRWRKQYREYTADFVGYLDTVYSGLKI